MRLPGPFTPAGIAMVTIPLYAGPILAGWGQLPPKIIPVLAGCFALYVTFTRAQALRPSLVMLVLVQLVLCGLFYGIGLFLAAQGRPLDLPLWVPLAVTGGAALLGTYRYRHMAAIDTLLDDALRATGTDRDSPGAIADGPAEAMANRVSRALWRARPLPEEVDGLMAPLTLRHPDRVLGLMLADLGEGSDAFDLATIRFAARDGVERDATMGLVLELTLVSTHATVRAEALALAHRLIDEDAPSAALPDRDWLAETDLSDPALAILATRLRRHLPE